MLGRQSRGGILTMKTETEYSGVFGEYHAVTEFLEYIVEIEYPFRGQCPSSNGTPWFLKKILTCAG
jgi:hypothetical protein